jgi:hypothetical protein
MSSNFIHFNSLGAFFDVNTGTLHPAMMDGTVDLDEDMAQHILECDLYEVQDCLDSDDKSIFMTYFGEWKNKLGSLVN